MSQFVSRRRDVMKRMHMMGMNATDSESMLVLAERLIQRVESDAIEMLEYKVKETE